MVYQIYLYKTWTVDRKKCCESLSEKTFYRINNLNFIQSLKKNFDIFRENIDFFQIPMLNTDKKNSD